MSFISLSKRPVQKGQKSSPFPPSLLKKEKKPVPPMRRKQHILFLLHLGKDQIYSQPRRTVGACSYLAIVLSLDPRYAMV